MAGTDSDGDLAHARAQLQAAQSEIEMLREDVAAAREQLAAASERAAHATGMFDTLERENAELRAALESRSAS
jgi:outer membrane murein-binding lipoprotein Lpp